MGISSSKIEDDKALQLCRERKKFVRQALDGRCSLASAHVNYIQTLKDTGTALRRFIEPEPPIESSLYTSTSATPEPLALTDKSLSQFSFSSPSPSPPNSTRFQANHMKFMSGFSKKVEEKPSVPIVGTVTSSSTPQNTTPRANERPETPPFNSNSNQPWDFFGLLHPNDSQFSFQEGREFKGDPENFDDDIRRMREEEGIPDLEDEEEEMKTSYESSGSEDEFDEPSADTLVRSFENRHRNNGEKSPNMISAGSESASDNGEKRSSPNLSPLRAESTVVAVPVDLKKLPSKDDGVENKIAPKDFLSSMKDIEFLFIKASESGKEVPRMLEANKLHFRPIVPGKDSGSSMASILLKACFSCGKDPSHVPEEPVQNSIKYLTWHRTESSKSSSSRIPLGLNSKDNIEGLTGNIFENFCMNSGSHASTLDRLYAWERKLFDEVKGSQMVRRDYDMKCKLLRQLESQGRQLESKGSIRIDKTRATVKDLHSRIRVAIHRIDHISKRIEELRDKELQPQLEELIEGLSRMWDIMSECHRLQYRIISIAYSNGNTKISINSESHRQITFYLENVLSSLSSSFTKWILAQKFYVMAIDGWLSKCVTLQQNSSKRKRRLNPPPWRNQGPPIYVTCGVWLEKLDTLPTKEVSDSIKGLASEISHFIPHQDKNQGPNIKPLFPKNWKSDSSSEAAVNMLRDEVSEDWISGFDRFRSSLEGFVGQLSNFAECSVTMYRDIETAIEEVKSRNEKAK